MTEKDDFWAPFRKLTFKTGDFIVWGLSPEYMANAVIKNAISSDESLPSAITYASLAKGGLWNSAVSHATYVSRGGSFEEAWIFEDISTGIRQIQLKDWAFESDRYAYVIRHDRYRPDSQVAPFSANEIELYQRIIEMFVENYYAPTVADPNEPLKRTGSSFNMLHLALIAYQFYLANPNDAALKSMFKYHLIWVIKAMASLGAATAQQPTFVCSQLCSQISWDCQKALETLFQHNPQSSTVQNSIFRLGFNNNLSAFNGLQEQIVRQQANNQVYCLNESQLQQLKTEFPFINDVVVQENQAIAAQEQPDTHQLANDQPQHTENENTSVVNSVKAWVNSVLSDEEFAQDFFNSVAPLEADGHILGQPAAGLLAAPAHVANHHIPHRRRLDAARFIAKFLERDLPEGFNTAVPADEAGHVLTIQEEFHRPVAIVGAAAPVASTFGAVNVSGSIEKAMEMILKGAMEKITAALREQSVEKLQQPLSDDLQRLQQDSNLVDELVIKWKDPLNTVTRTVGLQRPDIAQWNPRQLKSLHCNLWGFVVPGDLAFAQTGHFMAFSGNPGFSADQNK